MLVDVARYQDAERLPAHDLESAAAEAEAGHGFVWLGLFEPDQAELDRVARVFGLHPLAVEDALKARQRPKVERYSDSLFVVVKTAEYVDESEEVDFGEIQVFANAHYVVVIRHGHPVPLASVRADLEHQPEMLALGPPAVVHAVLDAVVDQYAQVLDGLDDDVNEVELEVFSAERPRGGSGERIYFLKREVLEFHRALMPLIQAMNRLHDDPMFADHVIGDYLRDVDDHLLRLADRLQTVRELLDAALGANATQLSLRQNEDMRRISAWVAIVAVPTMIAGIYGMNFAHMPELDWWFGYPFALGLMAAISLVLHRAFRRSGWL